MKNTKKLLIPGVIIFILAISALVFFVNKSQKTSSATYRIEVGYEASDAGVSIAKPNDHFPVKRPLIAIAINKYHKTIPGAKSTITVTKKGTSEILQKEDWIEAKEVTGYTIHLQNSSWNPGTYIIQWDRDGQQLASEEITLTNL